MAIKSQEDWRRELSKIQAMALMLTQIPVEDMLDSIDAPDDVRSPIYIPNLHRHNPELKEADRLLLESARLLAERGEIIKKLTD